jgi:hypothetical protein
METLPPSEEGECATVVGVNKDMSEIKSFRRSYLDACALLPRYDGAPMKPYMDLGYLSSGNRVVGSQYKPGPQDIKLLEEAGVTLVYEKARHHPHLAAGVGRALAEIDVANLISLRSTELGRPLLVKDVGSNAVRFQTCLLVHAVPGTVRECHHLMPQLQFGDEDRRAAARNRWSNCTHLWQECDCMPNADVLVMQHSLYYFTPEEVVNILKPEQILYATVHHHFSAGGSILDGQIAWTISKDGRLSVQAAGNASPYPHFANLWLKQGKLQFGNRVLVWDLLESNLETHLYGFRVLVTDTTVASPVVSYTDDYVERLKQTLSLVAKERATGPERTALALSVDFSVRKLYLKYGTLYATHEHDEVTMIPLDLIGDLRSSVVMQKRSILTISALVARARRLVGAGGWPSDLAPRVILLAVAAALTADVEAETAHVGVMNKRYNKVFEAHSHVLSGGFVEPWRWWHNLNPTNWFTTCCVTDEHHLPDAQAFHALAHQGLLPDHFPPTMLGGLRFKLEGAYKTQTVTLATTSKVVITSDSNFVEPTQASFKLSLIALGPFVPMATTQEIDDVVHAFKVRMGREVPLPVPGAWQEVVQLCFTRGTHSTTLNAWVMDEPIVITPDIKAQWLERTPPSQQRLLREAFDSLRHTPIMRRDLNGKVFLKLEKSAFLTAGILALFDPRLVISRTPRALASSGPFNWVYAKRVRDKLVIRPGQPSVWVTGGEANGQVFGRWVKAAWESIPPQYRRVAWGDMNKAEAHRSVDAFEAAMSCLETGDPDENCLLVLESEVKLKAFGLRHPVKITAVGPLASGSSGTSRDTAFRNDVCLQRAFGTAVWGRCMRAFNGDDWLVIYDSRCVIVTTELVKASYVYLGHSTDVEISRELWDCEFCQTLPYPVGEDIVFGPKIGRVLQRLPWALESVQEDPRGVAKGMMVACSHIPFLSDYLKIIISKVPSEVKAVDYEFHLGAIDFLRPTPETWAFVTYRYNIGEQDLQDLILLLEGVVLGTIVSWPRLADLVEKDA